MAKTIEAKRKQIALLQSRIERLQADINSLRKRDTAIRTRLVASRYGVSAATVIRMVEDGRLKGFRMPSKRGMWYITKRSINQFDKALSLRFNSPIIH